MHCKTGQLYRVNRTDDGRNRGDDRERDNHREVVGGDKPANLGAGPDRTRHEGRDNDWKEFIADRPMGRQAGRQLERRPTYMP